VNELVLMHKDKHKSVTFRLNFDQLVRIVSASFLASEMCELQSWSESLTGSLLEGIGVKEWEGVGGGKLNCLVTFHAFIRWSACWALRRRSGAKNDRGYCSKVIPCFILGPDSGYCDILSRFSSAKLQSRPCA
jgi:hypothetical protein